MTKNTPERDHIRVIHGLRRAIRHFERNSNRKMVRRYLKILRWYQLLTFDRVN